MSKQFFFFFSLKESFEFEIGLNTAEKNFTGGDTDETKKWQPVNNCLKVEVTTLACHLLFSLYSLEIFYNIKG